MILSSNPLRCGYCEGLRVGVAMSLLNYKLHLGLTGSHFKSEE